MERIKFIKRIGDSMGIILNKEEQRLFGISVNDKVYFTMKKMGSGKK
jgi:hypothetical protein